MKDRGKGVVGLSEFNFSAASEMPCKKHQNSSSVGVCPFCLREELLKLVCSECGEHRFSSCYCPDVSTSYRDSCSTVEIGNVGRISFLIKNESQAGRREEKLKPLLSRSNSNCMEISKHNNGLWKIRRLFRKRKNGEGFDMKGDILISDTGNVSGSRSLCSFRGDEGSDYGGVSSAKVSDESEPRKSGFRSIFGGSGFKLAKNGDTSNQSGDNDLSILDESDFIDLKLDTERDLSDGSKFQLAGIENLGNFEITTQSIDGRRSSVNGRGVKRSHKVWKWIFKYHSSNKDANPIHRS